MVAALGGEVVTYIPYRETAKTFKAIVDREPSQIAALAGVAYPEHAPRVTFPRDATDGVMSITKGKDRISFKRQLSDRDETTFTVGMVQDEDAGLIDGDGGMFTVLVK